ncbi:hypothetical protein [Rossellomorea aquimaris]|jgi:hypothetical protein|uniref:DUF2269 family protein n=1 Tax=Rossellomorea aquimaris TaxID=189382 RepID=A0A5D4UPJ0_9BACI|nr:hypothetical protein [Rossellomorea aquimaris]TYS82163.1 hypothetical protein FZD05_05150 [Rossellomorea aquimaris]TYS88791.1 hypothetical protein FZC85_05135 [Rossellomorea aquimaris]
MEYLLYRTLIYLHVISVVASIGPFFILLPMMKKLRTASDSVLPSYLDTFRFTVQLSKHSGHVLVGTGILLVLLGPWTWSTPWIIMTLVIMFCSLFFLARAFSPTLRKFGEDDADREWLVGKLNRTVWIYLILLLAMLWFMVVKPNLWM